MTKFDVEELMIDNFYHLDKSSKRKNEYAEFCSFCDVEYRRILKHVNTRWLSLELAITRTLQFASAKKATLAYNQAHSSKSK